MKFDEEELSLLQEARLHPIGRLATVERRPSAIERITHICQNLAQVALSKVKSSQQNQNNINRPNDYLRLG